MTKVRKQQFAGLDVIVQGGSDGLGGGQGPLCVLLHGFGAPGTDLVPLGKMLGGPQGLRFAFPAAPLSLGAAGGMDLGPFSMGDSRAWWMLDMDRIQRRLLNGRWDEIAREEPQGLTEARGQLGQAIAELQTELGVPHGKLVLGGFSQGSMLALDFALRTELPLLGVILLSCTIIAEPEWHKRMPARRGLRIFQSHGRHDQILPFAAAMSLRSQLTAAGLLVDWHEFAGGHEIPAPVLQAAASFLHTVAAP